jgi:hypothetical protein
MMPREYGRTSIPEKKLKEPKSFTAKSGEKQQEDHE